MEAFQHQAIVWRPSPEMRERTRLGQFLRQHQIPSLDALRERAAADPQWFWDAVVRMIDWPFVAPYEAVLDISAGVEWARWFVGGTSNVALAALERHLSGDHGERLAVIEETEAGSVQHWTYAALNRAVDRVAHGLRRLGVGPGDRVALYLPMGVEAVISLLAAAKVAAVAVPIFSGYGAAALATRLQDSGATLLITADGFHRRGQTVPLKELADEAVQMAPAVRHVIVVERLGNPIQWQSGRDIAWQALQALAPDGPYPTAVVAADAPLILIYTSGTTGAPKGTVHCHLGFPLKATADLWLAFDLKAEDHLLWYTDMGWMMGPWMVYGGLITGSTLILYDGAPDYPHPGRLWDMIDRHHVSVFGIAPTVVRALMAYGDGPLVDHRLTSLRVLGSSGEPWNPDPWQWFFECVGQGRCPIINYSGGTEISGGILSAFVSEPIKPCAFHGPLPGMVAAVVDEMGRPTHNQVGELVIQAPWPGMTQGFWQNRDRYLETYWSRWPKTWVHGDWAYIDDDGFWYILGRSDDTIKVAGKRIGPAEVESILVSHPDVLEAAAIGVPDAVKGESLVVFVVAKPGAHPDTGTLQAYVAQHLGRALRPQAVRIVPALPKTRNGKVVRRAIRASYLGLNSGDLSTLENAESLDAIRQLGAQDGHVQEQGG